MAQKAERIPSNTNFGMALLVKKETKRGALRKHKSGKKKRTYGYTRKILSDFGFP